MLDVYRQGRDGNLIERSGPVLVVDFGDEVIISIFKGLRVTRRHMEQKARSLPGFAPEDKFHIAPVRVEEVDNGLKQHVDIWTDPGGDITLELSERAGEGREHGVQAQFLVNDEGLLERGIDTLMLPALFAIEQERQTRLRWGKSSLNPDWRP